LAGVVPTVGLDIGATKWLLATSSAPEPMVEAEGRTLEDPAATLVDIVGAARKIDCRPSMVGCGFAGSVSADGRVVRWPNRPSWEGFELGSELERGFGTSVAIDDDGICAGLGEIAAGAVPRDGTFLCVAFGTGVASGLFVDGQPWRPDGPSSFALGHVRMGIGSAMCSCHRRGCLQEIIRERPLPDSHMSRVAELLVDVASLLSVGTIIVTGGRLDREPELRNGLVARLTSEAKPLHIQIRAATSPATSVVAGALVLSGHAAAKRRSA
jgi:hypothetical protein